MRTVIFGCLLSLAAVGSAHAQYTPRTNDEIALINAEDQWCDAAIKRDKARLEDVFADDLIYLTAKGSMNKAQTIADYDGNANTHYTSHRGFDPRIW